MFIMFYSVCSYQHVLAATAAFFRVMLLLQEHKCTNVIVINILYFVGFSALVSWCLKTFICILYFDIYFKLYNFKLRILYLCTGSKSLHLPEDGHRNCRNMLDAYCVYNVRYS